MTEKRINFYKPSNEIVELLMPGSINKKLLSEIITTFFIVLGRGKEIIIGEDGQFIPMIKNAILFRVQVPQHHQEDFLTQLFNEVIAQKIQSDDVSLNYSNVISLWQLKLAKPLEIIYIQLHENRN